MRWLERDTQRLLAAPDVEFIRRLPHWLQEVRSDRVASRHADALLDEIEAAIERFAEHDATTIAEAVALRDELLARVPAADDSSMQPPSPGGGLRWEYAMSLANFDAIAGGRREPRTGVRLTAAEQQDDPSRSAMLLRILRSKLHELQWIADRDGPVITQAETNQRPDLDDLSARLADLENKHQHELSAFVTESRTAPGASLWRLDWLAEETNPPPQRAPRTEEEQVERMERMLRELLASPGPIVRRALAGKRLEAADARALTGIAQRAREDVQTVYDGLLRRIEREQQEPPVETPSTVDKEGTVVVPSLVLAAFGALSLVSIVISILVAPAWLAVGAIGVVVVVTALHRYVWRWPPSAWACVVVVAAAGAAGIVAARVTGSDGSSSSNTVRDDVPLEPITETALLDLNVYGRVAAGPGATERTTAPIRVLSGNTVQIGLTVWNPAMPDEHGAGSVARNPEVEFRVPKGAGTVFAVNARTSADNVTSSISGNRLADAVELRSSDGRLVWLNKARNVQYQESLVGDSDSGWRWGRLRDVAPSQLSTHHTASAFAWSLRRLSSDGNLGPGKTEALRIFFLMDVRTDAPPASS